MSLPNLYLITVFLLVVIKALFLPLSWCHNLIFTPGIFSDAGTQNEAVRTESTWSDEGSLYQNDLKMRSGVYFLKVDQVWPGLTKFDWSWPSLTEVWPSRSDPTGIHYTQKPSKHGSEYISRNLERFDQGWPSLTEVWPNHWPDRKLDWADRPLTNV